MVLRGRGACTALLAAFGLLAGCGGGVNEAPPAAVTAASAATSKPSAPAPSAAPVSTASPAPSTAPVSTAASNPSAAAPSVVFAPSGKAREIHKAIVAELKAAKKSIDVACFLLTSTQLSDELVAAKKRGVAVRVLLDGNQDKTVALSKGKDLAAGGADVKVIATKSGAQSPKFHHKFAVVDASVVVTGSFNWTVTGDEDNYENVVVLRDAAVAQAFSREFDSIFTTGKAGVASSGDVVFAPSGGARAVETKIVDELSKATKEVIVAMYLMTSDETAQALIAAAKRGVKVSLLSDATQIKYYQQNYDALVKAGVDKKRVVLGGGGAFAAKFHQKYAVIDGKTVITGSYNWDPQQDEQGYDNLVVIHDAALAKKYIDDFAKTWSSPVAQ